MIFEIKITQPAQDDLRGIYKYISEDLQNHTAASNMISKIDKRIQSLKKSPERYPLVRDSYLASKGFRVTVVKNYLVFFIIRKVTKSVSVMRVLYGRRDWLRILSVDANELSEE